MNSGISRKVLEKREKIWEDAQSKIIAYQILHNKKILTNKEIQDIIFGKVDI
jgi:hypothetical protein